MEIRVNRRYAALAIALGFSVAIACTFPDVAFDEGAEDGGPGDDATVHYDAASGRRRLRIAGGRRTRRPYRRVWHDGKSVRRGVRQQNRPEPRVRRAWVRPVRRPFPRRRGMQRWRRVRRDLFSAVAGLQWGRVRRMRGQPERRRPEQLRIVQRDVHGRASVQPRRRRLRRCVRARQHRMHGRVCRQVERPKPLRRVHPRCARSAPTRRRCATTAAAATRATRASKTATAFRTTGARSIPRAAPTIAARATRGAPGPPTPRAPASAACANTAASAAIRTATAILAKAARANARVAPAVPAKGARRAPTAAADPRARQQPWSHASAACSAPASSPCFAHLAQLRARARHARHDAQAGTRSTPPKNSSTMSFQLSAFSFGPHLNAGTLASFFVIARCSRYQRIASSAAYSWTGL